jgi:hypothetical protein
MTMLRAIAPYVVIGMIISGGAGIAYSSGLIGVLGAYGVVLVAGVIALIGYVRWDDSQHAGPES